MSLQKNLRMSQRITWKGKKQIAVTKNNKMMRFHAYKEDSFFCWLLKCELYKIITADVLLIKGY